jgi:Ser/Thr protein kinase RdoA (MazF antagonist)
MFQDNLESWEMLEAFGTGYAGVTTLTPAEIRALPDLALLRLATGLTHYMGRCLSGLEPWDRVVPYLAQRALFLADWLYRHEEALVEQAARWWNRPA